MKNESRCIRRCIESTFGVVDDYVCVDTGSTDGTLDIVRELGIEPICVEWPGRFDTARNIAMDRVQTEWALVLDADEWLMEGAAPIMKKLIANDAASGYCLNRRDLYVDGRTGEQWVLRLYRMHPLIRFQGAIHEHVKDDSLLSAFPNKRIYTTEMGFLHDGYSPDLVASKAVRNLPILELELKENPGQIYYEIERFMTLKQMRDSRTSEALMQLKQRILDMSDLDEAPDRTIASFFSVYLPIAEDAELHGFEMDSFLTLARGWFPDSPPVRFLVAQTEIRRKNLRAAYHDLLAIAKLKETGKYDRFTMIDPQIMNEGLYLNLALVAHQLGNIDLARQNYLALLEIQPDNETALHNLTLL